ncbi:MAG: hypothetical protein B6I32_04160, partial [Desulfobacterium sp. 4572_20]
MGRNNREYSTPETAKRMYRIYNEIYRTEKFSRIADYEIIRKDKSIRILEMSASLMLLETDPKHPHYERLKNIEKSVQSGSKLTNQL